MKLVLLYMAPVLLSFLSWLIIITERDPDKPDWFKKISNSIIGEIILFISGIIVLYTIFFSYSPSAFWDQY